MFHLSLSLFKGSFYGEDLFFGEKCVFPAFIVVFYCFIYTFTLCDKTHNQFGGVLGEVYQPQNLTTGIGDTIQWQGTFASHPLSSTIIPNGAASFHVTSGTVFSYVVTQPGTYNYKCDFHGGNGMFGSFSTVTTKHVILLEMH